jgi:membrane protease YdiL (CAAX protease family)
MRYFDGRRWVHEDQSPGEDGSPAKAPRVPVRSGVLAVVVLLLSLLMSGLGLVVALELGVSDAVGLGIAMALGYLPVVGYAVISAKSWGSGDVLTDLGLRSRWVDLGWGPLIWLLAITAQILLGSVILLFDLPTVSNTEGMSELSGQTAQMWVLIFAAVVMAPIVEEIVFRGLLLRALVGVMPAAAAILIQAVLFGLLHLNPEAGVANLGLVVILTGVGAVFGAAAHFLGRIAPTIIAHAIFNGVVLTLVLSGVLEDFV